MGVSAKQVILPLAPPPPNPRYEPPSWFRIRAEFYSRVMAFFTTYMLFCFLTVYFHPFSPTRLEWEMISFHIFHLPLDLFDKVTKRRDGEPIITYGLPLPCFPEVSSRISSTDKQNWPVLFVTVERVVLPPVWLAICTKKKKRAKRKKL